MSQMIKSRIEPLQAAAFGLPVSQPQGSNSRTSWKRCLLDTVLPALALLSMSVLTVTMIVLVVTTVAHGGWLTPGTYVSVDPWSGVYPDAGTVREAGGQPWESAGAGDVSLRPQSDAGYFAAEMPE